MCLACAIPHAPSSNASELARKILVPLIRCTIIARGAISVLFADTVSVREPELLGPGASADTAESAGCAGALESVLPGDLGWTVSRHVPLALRRSVQPSGLSGARCFAYNHTVFRLSPGAEYGALLRSGSRRLQRPQRREWCGELPKWRVAARCLSHAEAFPGSPLHLA